MDPADLRGAYPALVTPMTAAGAPHLDDLARLVTDALADGARGVLVAGSTGEGALLTGEERAALTRTARDAAGPDAVVLAGASGPHLDALHDDVAHLGSAGADAVLVLAPATYPLRPAELVDAHLAVAERAEVPTLAYHIPQLTGSWLTGETAAELAAHPRVLGAKDSSPDPDRRAELIAGFATRGRVLLTGHAPSVARALDDGAAGAILAVGNLRQRAASALVAAHAADDRDAVARHQAALAATAAGLAEVDASAAAACKAALQLRGTIAERWCRAPLRSVDGPALDRVRTALLR